MHMLSMLASSGNNIDSFLINLIRFCNEQGMPLEQSMFLKAYAKDNP